MSKAPQDLPAVGDQVKLRGRGGIGIVLHITPRNWVEVKWEPIRDGHLLIAQPRICHLFELEKIPAK